MLTGETCPCPKISSISLLKMKRSLLKINHWRVGMVRCSRVGITGSSTCSKPARHGGSIQGDDKTKASYRQPSSGTPFTQWRTPVSRSTSRGSHPVRHAAGVDVVVVVAAVEEAADDSSFAGDLRTIAPSQKSVSLRGFSSCVTSHLPHDNEKKREDGVGEAAFHPRPCASESGSLQENG